jgi:hypothetical protein
MRVLIFVLELIALSCCDFIYVFISLKVQKLDLVMMINAVNLFPEIKYQELIGIGTALTEAATVSWSTLSEPQ